MDNKNYQVTIKGLVFDQQGRLMLLREDTGGWDLPGGRLEHGEDFHTTLKRECREEMGIDCQILDAAPHWAWSARGGDGYWKVVLCFRIHLPHLEFSPSAECVGLDFFDAASLSAIPLVAQMLPLRDHLPQSAAVE